MIEQTGADLEVTYDVVELDNKEALLKETQMKARIVVKGGLENVDVRRTLHRASRQMSEALDGSGAHQPDAGLDQLFYEIDRVEKLTSGDVSRVLAGADLDAISDLDQGSKDVVDSLNRDGSDLIDKEMSGLEDL